MEFSRYNGSPDALMEINGCTCTFNSPPAKKDGDTLRLPPYAPRAAFKVDEYPACPTNWMHGSPTVNSYFVPIKPEHGMWLDLNGCFKNTHHIAALISVQGVNPLTGMPLIDTVMRLEQYRTKCPKHDKEFGADLYCEECGYKWVPQNYLASNVTPESPAQFWLDGFRTDDGTVRQYYFTEEESKGVASQVIGDKRVFAVAIAFYRSKAEKPKPVYRPAVAFAMGGGALPAFSSGPTKKYLADGAGWGAASASSPKLLSARPRGPSGQSVSKGGFESTSVSPEAGLESMNSYDGDTACDFDPLERCGSVEPVKQLEIGAGAKINQRIYKDTESLDFWEDAPVGMLYINYVDEGTAKRIISIGKKDMTKGGEGFLAGLAVGRK